MSIKTPLDINYQIKAISSLRKGIEDYEKRHGWRGPITNKLKDKNWEKKIKNLKIDPTLSWKIAEIINLNENEINFKTLNGIKGNISSSKLKWAIPKKKLLMIDLT